MRYYSSRDTERAAGVDFETALLAGLAPDGGLYLPEQLPQIEASRWRGSGSPAALAARLLPELTGLSSERLHILLGDALDFPLPVRRLSAERYVLELFHGPTAAFKDVGARAMARLMDDALERRGRRATVLVATSGDTGSAVADAFAGAANVAVALLYPRGRVSAVQERQLIARRPGVRAFAVEGTFDDCQRLVKGAFDDPELTALGLSTANSINVGRLLPQLVYYFWAVERLALEHGVAEPPQVVVPSGNLGNLTAGVFAAGMGLRFGGMSAAHNANDYFVRFLHDDAEPYDFKASVATLSNAMDVGAPSNFERLFALAGSDLRRRLSSATVDDDATTDRMRRTYREDDYLICPHTAVALEALDRLRAGDEELGARPALVLATAHPAKFPEAVEAATGVEPEPHPGLAALVTAETAVTPLAPHHEALREALLRPPADA